MLIPITSIKISSCQMPSATAQSFNVIDRGNKGERKPVWRSVMLDKQQKLRPRDDSVLLPRKLQSLEDLLHLVREASVRCRIYLFLDCFCGQAQISHQNREHSEPCKDTGLFRMQLNQTHRNERKGIKIKGHERKKFDFRPLIPHLIVRLGCGLTLIKALYKTH